MNEWLAWLKNANFTIYEMARIELKDMDARIVELERANESLETALLEFSHLPSCPSFTGPYDLGDGEPPCTCGFDRKENEG